MGLFSETIQQIKAMKTATITKIESVNQGTIWTVTLQIENPSPTAAYNLDLELLEAGEPFCDGEAGGKHWFNFWDKPALSVGDCLTDEGEVVKADVAGKITETHIIETRTLEDVWCEKHGLNR